MHISKEKALNLIEHNDKVYHYADKQYEDIVYATTQKICEVVAEMPAADVQPVDRWINVKDKLPVIGKVVIVCDKQGGVGAMELLSNGQWYRHGMAWSAEWIVYWQPLPEPPKEG